MRSLSSVHILLCSLWLAACCFPPRPCTNVDPFPSIVFYDTTGAVIPYAQEDSLEGFRITDVRNLTVPEAELNWRVSDNYGGQGFPQQDAYLQLVDDGAYVDLEDDVRRENTWVITYDYEASTFNDTVEIVSWAGREDCCSQSRIDYETFSYSGTLVESFERRSDVPGFYVYLRKP